MMPASSVWDRNLEEFQRAAVAIQRRWRAKQYKRQFDYLKHAICVAELSLTKDIVKILNPAESEMLKDPALQAKLKIRFGGSAFPPIVLFKVYTSMAPKKEGPGTEGAGMDASNGKVKVQPGKGGRVHYITGQKMITPHSKAAEDALRQMGEKQYRQHLAEDSSRQEQLKVTGEVDVTSIKDYMLFMSNTDESPAYLGGKDNTWRKLDLSAWHRPNRSCVVDFYKARKYQSEGTASVVVPRGRDRTKSRESRRSSRQATRRADQMRALYCKEKEDGGEEASAGLEQPEPDVDFDEDGELDDQAAFDMIQWSQQLNYNDI